jgi:hypothetical protein
LKKRKLTKNQKANVEPIIVDDVENKITTTKKKKKKRTTTKRINSKNFVQQQSKTSSKAADKDSPTTTTKNQNNDKNNNNFMNLYDLENNNNNNNYQFDTKFQDDVDVELARNLLRQAHTCSKKNDLKDALGLYKRAFRIKKRVLGSDHLDTMQAYLKF